MGESQRWSSRRSWCCRQHRSLKEIPMDVHVYIGVTDLVHGIAFYTQGIGLRLRRRLRPNWVELDGASIPLFLLVSNRPQGFVGPWTVHLDFVTDDLDAAVR